MVKILALGSSIVAGPYDNIDTPYRVDSPTAPHVPEGGWRSIALFNIHPRHGLRDQATPEGVAWAVRAADYLPSGSVQIWNEGVGSGRSASYATTGDNFIDAIYTRGFEPLPNDINYAVFAIMTNDANIAIPAGDWQNNVETVIQYLNTKNIKTILVYDFLRVAANQQFYYDYLACAKYLVSQYNLPPLLDIYTVSKANYYNGFKTWFDADEIHPNVTGHQGVAKLFANYLATNHVVPDENAKWIIADWNETGKTVYTVVRRESDGYILDGFSGEFMAGPVYPYTFMQEHPVIKGRYEVAETRSVWNDGRYTVAIYKQLGASPTPTTDEKIGTGEIFVKDDMEACLDASPSFIHKWISNRLVEEPLGTWKLYDDDDSTVLRTWTWNDAARTRSKAV